MADSCSDSEEDPERLFSQSTVDLLIVAVINNPPAAKGRVKRKWSRSLVLHAPQLLQSMLNFELKTRGCMPRTRNRKEN